MGKSTGFIDYERKVSKNRNTIERTQDFEEFHNRLSREDQKLQGARCMECGIPFCQSGILIKGMVSGCPLNNLIPEWNDLIYKDKWELALKRLLKTNPFPEFTGRVCPAPCEGACTAGLNSKPVTIKENERAIIEVAYENDWIKAEPPLKRNKYNIAVVGSGPSGLAAAYSLNKLGYNVTVYEREDRVGGLLMYGIPNMKLDKGIINKRVSIMREDGITFILNTNIGVDISGDELLEKYDRVILCTGSPKARNLLLDNNNANGLFFALDFLKTTTKELLDNRGHSSRHIDVKNKDVIIIGGGDTGTDCVATAIRLGAKSIKQIEIMGKPNETRNIISNPWPEYPKILKCDYGHQECIDILGYDPREYNKTVKKINIKNGKINSLELIKVNWCNQDNTIIPKEIVGSNEIVKCDVVLIAMGFIGSEDYLKDSFNLGLNNRGNIQCNGNKFITDREKVFTCGDARTGQSLVVWAIKDGIELSKEIHKSFYGE
ncbi:MAG: glutamate synthase subunit beta [Clostridium sp.]